jgi:hypothetical protein
MLGALTGTLNSDSSNAQQNLSSSLISSSALNDFLNSQWMTNLNSYNQKKSSSISPLGFLQKLI